LEASDMTTDSVLVLRYTDSATTRRFYLKLQSKKQGAAAMRRLERSLSNKARIKAQKNGSK